MKWGAPKTGMAPVGAPTHRARNLILAGLIPFATMSLMTAAVFLKVPWMVTLPLAFAANFPIGWLVGRSVSRHPFLKATGVAMAGWFAGLPGVTVLYFALIAPRLVRSPGEQMDQGFGMFICIAVILGLLGSPVAGIAAK